MKLIPNREYGDCVACCHHIPIDQDDFVKLSNIDWEHLIRGLGCGIYNNRSNTCAVSGFLNYALQDASNTNNIDLLKMHIKNIIDDCQKAPKAKLTIKNGRIKSILPE